MNLTIGLTLQEEVDVPHNVEQIGDKYRLLY